MTRLSQGAATSADLTTQRLADHRKRFVLTSVLHVRRAAWFDSARVVADEFELVSSLKLLDKLAEVLARPKLERWVSQAGAHEYLDALAESATMIEDPPDPPRLVQLALTYLAWRGAPGKSEKPAHLPRRCTGGHQAARPAIQFITIQIYAGVPLTTIAKQCGTSDTMIEKHYADVIENWDGVQQPAESKSGPPAKPVDAQWTSGGFAREVS